MAGEIRVGTCSWTDPSLLACGRFYPPDASTPEGRLRYYSGQFSVVEVDSSYYSLPREAAARVWVERTPPGFRFDVKAFRLFTHHPTPATALPKDIRGELPTGLRERENLYLKDVPPELQEEMWRRFEEALGPLRRAGKLGVVLFQFPPWFRFSPASIDYLQRLGARASGYRAAVEFRQLSWLAPEKRGSTVSALREAGLAFVCVDEPQGLASSVPPVVEATREDLAVVRFHGRNRATWDKKGISVAERFNYLYAEEELCEWIPRIRELAESAQEVHVLFNNCFEDRAVVNARQMKFLLSRVPGFSEETGCPEGSGGPTVTDWSEGPRGPTVTGCGEASGGPL
ncbi:MAG TPA: DUF72 domain-containing protein [Firmicutes bacterium]|nr:DUF72 domain-containing protein [Bacillota bacterium]